MLRRVEAKVRSRQEVLVTGLTSDEIDLIARKYTENFIGAFQDQALLTLGYDGELQAIMFDVIPKDLYLHVVPEDNVLHIHNGKVKVGKDFVHTCAYLIESDYEFDLFSNILAYNGEEDKEMEKLVELLLYINNSSECEEGKQITVTINNSSSITKTISYLDYSNAMEMVHDLSLDKNIHIDVK